MTGTVQTLSSQLKVAFIALVAGLVSVSSGPVRAVNPGLPIVFIVNKENPAKSVSVRDVVDYYEKTKREWPYGVPVRFIDRAPGTPERAAFLRDILKQSESDIDLFWFTQRLRSGNSIPIQVSTDTLVIEMVKTFRGAIGYISSSTRIPDGQVKAIEVTGLHGT